MSATVRAVPLRSPIVTASAPPRVARSSSSTPSRSIRMVPGLRRKTALVPSAVRDISSSALEPLKANVS